MIETSPKYHFISEALSLTELSGGAKVGENKLKQECIPVGCVLPYLPACTDRGGGACSGGYPSMH